MLCIALIIPTVETVGYMSQYIPDITVYIKRDHCNCGDPTGRMIKAGMICYKALAPTVQQYISVLKSLRNKVSLYTHPKRYARYLISLLGYRGFPRHLLQKALGSL